MKKLLWFTISLLVIVSLSLINTNISGKIFSVQENGKTRYLECKVDGKLLKASDNGLIILYVPQKKEVTIWGKTSEGLISIIIDAVDNTGTYTIKGNSKNGAGILTKSEMFEVKKSGTPFNVIIKTMEDLNVPNNKGAKAIRGTFSGKLKNDQGIVVEITDGKFSAQ